MEKDIKKILRKDIQNTNIGNIKTTKKETKFIIPFMLIIPALIFFTLFTFIPLFKVIIDSTENTNPNYLTTYGNVWKDADWYLAIFNSFLYAVISVPTTIALALLISFNISNVITKNFREFWQTIFFLPYVTSMVAVSIVFSEIFLSQDYGVINWIFGVDIAWLERPFSDSPIAFIPLLVFGIWHQLAFKVLILTSAMLSIDKRLYDAASIDGASKKDIFFNITLPSLETTIWYLVTIGLITSLKVFPLALFENDASVAMNNMPTMMGYVYECVKNVDYGKAGAASVSLIFVVIIFNYIIKKMISGMQYLLINKRDNDMKKEIQEYELMQKNREFTLAKKREGSAIVKQKTNSTKEIKS